MIDEGDPGGRVSCASGLAGVCAAGATRCSGGAVRCIATVMPGAMTELCDALDNDCDGAVNNGDPGGGVACATGLAGACSAGLTLCSAEAIACVPRLLPGSRTETCNAIDDDCNGTPDDGFNVGMDCAAGMGSCTATGAIECAADGTARCNARVGTPSTEVCGNDIDEDCDGVNGICGVDAGPIAFDVGVMPDAGGDAGPVDVGLLDRDAGLLDRDAGLLDRDAGLLDRDAALRGDTGVTSGFAGGACGCRAVGSGDVRWSSMLLGLLGLALIRRRRGH